jgi:hypothetical protein
MAKSTYDGDGAQVGIIDTNYGGRILAKFPTSVSEYAAPFIVGLEANEDITQLELISLAGGGYNLADADNSRRADGIALETISNGAYGKVAVGMAIIYDTDITTGGGYAAGDYLYISTTAGAKTKTAPSGSGNIVQRVGRVIQVTATYGVIYYSFDLGQAEVIA